MNNFVNAVTEDLSKSKKDSLTKNDAVTRGTSGQAHLDLFSIVGACRNVYEDALRLFSIAYAEDKELALRIMLWARDIRGGAGERQVFRNVIRHLSVSDPKVVERLAPYVAEFGRWDDVIESVPLHSEAFNIAAATVKAAIDAGDGLAAKWMPRKGAVAVALRDFWKMTPKQYRKYLVNHTQVVETQMCNKQWDEIEFSKLPSLAALRYQQAFLRNTPETYESYKSALVKGDAKINSAALFPHNIVSNIRHGKGDALVLNEQWKALPDYLGAKSGKVLVMSDVSGSMDCSIGGNVTCMDVSIALGLYTSERLKGVFKDLVLTFSTTPAFHKIVGVSLPERVRNLNRAKWSQSTNVQGAFELVLDTAKANTVLQSDMPETVIIISDMEFDRCGSKTNFGAIKKQYDGSGYVMPNLVFWNVNGRAGNNPVKFDAEGVCMVSGYSPAILETVLSGKKFDPMKAMFDAVGIERYDIAAKVI